MDDPTIQQVPEGQETPPAAPEPPANPDPMPEANRLGRRPQNVRGAYYVLAAIVGGEGYLDVGWYRGHGHDHVRRQVIADAEAGHLPKVRDALEGKGVEIRPVPGESWPKLDKPSRYETTRRLVV